MKAIRHQLTSE